ncbi:hypothetical protein [Streptomyces sp. BPTC-684]|uniref:hypothetical protein n=1 Tax=Streptomyces sp. BPTC-684 TaxID=3043734 RepID=UPI0024B1AE4D|nr:hypothetical protein [Streptomyces sp. BPTC-684]WHM36307.1 hypothetical protein QIY60_04755 [Streptomyces sp. BPTC-684]
MSDTPAAPQGDPTAPTTQDPSGTPAPTPPVPAPQGEDTAATIARLESDLAAARAEAGKQRVTAKQKAADEARAQLAQDIGRALGIIPDGQEADPAQLTAQLTASQAQARQTAVELAVYRTAREAGGDPDALLDSRQFAEALADLDPSDSAAVQAAVETAVASNPRLAAPAARPNRGGAEFSGPPTGDRKPATLHDAITAALGS